MNDYFGLQCELLSLRNTPLRFDSKNKDKNDN